MKVISNKYSVGFYSFVLAVFGFWYFFGGPLWILGFVAALPWFLLLTARFNKVLSLAFVGGIILVIEIWVGVISSFISLPVFVAIGGSLLVIGFAGAIFNIRNPPTLKPVSKPDLVNLLSISAGAIIWVFGLAAAQVVPRSSKFGWVMLGDSANNILMARDVISAGGIEIGEGANPAPLPSALIAFSIAPSQENSYLSPNLFSDVTNLSVLWAALVALTCVVTGCVVFVVTSKYTNRRLRVRFLAALGSLLPLSWFFTGYPLDFGFFNSQVALPILFLCVLVYYASIEQKRFNLIVQPVFGTLLLAIWAPLVVVPLALFVSSAVTMKNLDWRWPAKDYWFVAFTSLQFVLYGLIVVFPMILSMSSSVGVAGGIYDFSHIMLWGLAVATPVFARLAARGWADPRFVGPLAVSIGVIAAQFYLLYLNKALEDPWTYYPLKFLWIASTLLLLLLTLQIAAILIQRFKSIWVFYPAVLVGIVAIVIFLNWSPMKVSGYVWKDPLQRILAGSFMGRGDSTALRIFDSSTTENTEIYWKTAIEDEGAVNFWLLQNAANSIKPAVQTLREFAYGMYDSENPASLCAIAQVVPRNLVVHSPVKELQEQINNLCPEFRIIVTTKSQ